MRDFYQQKPIRLDEIIEKYTPRIEGFAPTQSHIAYCEDQAIGKIQCYKICDYPEYGDEIGVTDGISVDLFIRDPSFLRKGLGRQILQSYLTDVAFKIFEDEKYCYICHEVENLAAIACSKAVGFSFIKDVIESGKPSKLFKYSKQAH